MLQTRFMKQNDPCDDCIICFQGALSCAVLMMTIAGAKEEEAEAQMSPTPGENPHPLLKKGNRGSPILK